VLLPEKGRGVGGDLYPYYLTAKERGKEGLHEGEILFGERFILPMGGGEKGEIWGEEVFTSPLKGERILFPLGKKKNLGISKGGGGNSLLLERGREGSDPNLQLGRKGGEGKWVKGRRCSHLPG